MSSRMAKRKTRRRSRASPIVRGCSEKEQTLGVGATDGSAYDQLVGGKALLALWVGCKAGINNANKV